MKSIRSSTRILLAGLALGLCADLLFHGRAPGISTPIFVVLLLGALFALGRAVGVSPAWRNLWLVVPLLFLAAMVAVRANPFLTFLNLAAVWILLGLVAHFYAAGRLEALGLLGYPLALVRTGANALFQAAPLLKEAAAERSAERRRSVAPLVRGLLLALPVVAVFACLLASADLVFGRWLTGLVRLRFWQDVLGRAVVVLVAAWLLAGALAYSLRRKEQGEGLADQLLGDLAGALRPSATGEDGLQKLLAALGDIFSIGFVEATIVLGSVNALFLAFGWIQATYLFGGQANITAQGYTYAEYARRGFFELVTVAVLALALGLGLRWLGRRETPGRQRAFNGLSSLLAGLVLVMLASAFQRLRLYEIAYGFTETRLYVYVFMIWLGVSLVWFAVTQWRLSDRFAVGALAAVLGFVVTLNAINPDAFIARQNLARYAAGGELDAVYLTRLSDDALPVLLAAVEQTSGEEQKVLQEYLRRRRAEVGTNAARQGWPAFHLAHWQAESLLAAGRGTQ